MLQSLRKETEGKIQMLLSLRKNGRTSLFKEVRVDNPRASYRAENPTNPKIGHKYQPDIQIPPTAGDRKNTPKIPEKY